MSKISISKIKLFKACRRAYWLKYVEGLEPVQRAESLETGASYHARLEQYYRDGYLETDTSKESAMAEAYVKHIAPTFKMKVSEEWLEKDGFIGRADGIAEDGRLVEHKTTSGSVGDDYEFNTQWDEQIPMYMWLSGARQMYYTVIRKPTIRLKKGETEEEFHDRCVEWYDEDTENKIRVFMVSRTDEEIAEFEESLMRIRDEMQTDHFYRNSGWCNRWGRMCEYASVCLHYDPDQEYVEFTRRDKS